MELFGNDTEQDAKQQTTKKPETHGQRLNHKN